MLWHRCWDLPAARRPRIRARLTRPSRPARRLSSAPIFVGATRFARVFETEMSRENSAVAGHASLTELAAMARRRRAPGVLGGPARCDLALLESVDRASKRTTWSPRAAFTLGVVRRLDLVSLTRRAWFAERDGSSRLKRSYSAAGRGEGIAPIRTAPTPRCSCSAARALGVGGKPLACHFRSRSRDRRMVRRRWRHFQRISSSRARAAMAHQRLLV